MKEELYIIKDGERIAVDLSTPSGITLKMNSNLLEDLSKMTASHSYTFSLPFTRRNRESFDMIEDVRHGSHMFGVRLKAEYRLNGIPLFKDGNIYVDEVAGGYKAVMTWQLAGGFEALKNADINICELNSLGTYRAGLTGGGSRATNEPGIPYDNWRNDMDVTRPWYTPGYPGASPQPVVPVYRIIQLINDHYGTSFDFGAPYQMSDNDNEAHDFIKYGVVPLVTRKHPDYSVPVERPISSTILPLVSIGGKNNCLQLSNNDGEYITVSGNEISVSETYRYGTGYDNVANIVIKGEMKVWYGLNESKPSDNVELRIYGRYRHIENKDVKEEVREISSVTCEIEKQQNGSYYKFEIDEEIKQGININESREWMIESVFIGFSENIKTTLNTSVTAEPAFREWRGGYDIYVTENLPEVSCLTFMKSIFYIIGAFPVTASDGSVRPAYFNDLRGNLSARHYIDWSGKINGTISQMAESTKFTFGGLGQESFFLMKNESIDKDGEDGYQSYKSHIVTKNGVLEKQKTIIQLPFYGASTAEGKTINTYKIDDGVLKWQDAKPAVGMIKMATAANWDRPLGSTSTPNGGSNVLGMYLWQFPKDLSASDTFAYLQSMALRPYVVTESFRLNEFDVRDLNYSIPIYIDKYNSFFAVVSIQYTARSSAKVELVRLPLTTEK